MNPTRLALVLLVTSAASGCGGLPVLPPAGTDGAGQLLHEAVELRTLTPAERGERRRTAERALAGDDTPAARTRLALLLMHGTPSGEDVARARSLLAPVASASRGADPGLAALAQHLLDEWSRETTCRAQADELTALRVRTATLEERLRAIRSIEQQLERRDRPQGSAP